ncbi:MAG: TIGR04282 family arsenosugar biosynthesis glycosyltransferase [Rhodocyclaceae bacterium]|nr:TIGR04282 family arsenosugar biosynthesis glycosyltransferase [Rhodocyclaceae bacterium]MDZ4214074.1 TIGR04282 family arsenosugar biosynthesis glycosyltransferase [Rhodocyclaceae bacterium]
MSITRILIFAKAPVPWRVKTRLIPALGAAGAARLARRMLENTLANALDAVIGPVELCASPLISAPDWAGIPLPHGVECSAQGDGDLGERMARASQRAFAQNDRVLLIGTDCPGLSAGHLRAAAAALDGHAAAIYPAVDGGYSLLGLRAFHPSLFEDIPWSTSSVAKLTLARMQALEWSVWQGDVLTDIDEPADLVHWAHHRSG